MYLTPFRKGKSGKTLTVEQVSDMVGKSTPATAHALTRLHGLGFLELLNTELKEYALTIRGLKHVPGNVKPKSDVPKLKTDKQSGEVEVSKKNRVLTLLKNPDLTVKQISEMTGAAQSYIRGIRERAAKKMGEPKAGSIKRKVYDALRAGGTLVDVAKRCKVTVSYAYQIRQQMLSAKII
jgi:DNA-directed RNA polymerase specialized sigma subunit